MFGRKITAELAEIGENLIRSPLPASPTLTRAIGSDPGVIEVNMKGARVRICANAASGVIAATLKALRP
jgi:hypothetical protein